MLASLATIAVLAASSAVVQATPCPIFSTSGDLYIFGSTSVDLKLGPASSWTSTTPFATLSDASSRPSFNSNNTQCFLNQYANTLVVIYAEEETASSAIHLYDFKAEKWSVKQTTGSPDQGWDGAVCALDHDTVVLYCYAPSAQALYFLLLDDSVKDASTVTWKQSNNPTLASFDAKAYTKPTVGAANNHLHFIGTPGANASQAEIFFIHYAYWQTTAQSYPSTAGQKDFPSSHGKTATIPITDDASSLPNSFSFIPDDNSATYIVNAVTNSTIVLPAPTNADTDASYTASSSALVQLTSDNQLWYLNLPAGASWTRITNSALVPGNEGQSSNSTNGTVVASAGATATTSLSGTRSASSATRSSTASATTSSTQSGAGKNAGTPMALCVVALTSAAISLAYLL